MARHASLDITDEQEANLRKLAAYLMTLPEDYPDFEMRDFVQASDGEAKEFAHLPVCGTAACAVGHGPNAGIAPHDRETWRAYSERLSGFNFYDDEWDWCFSGGWADVDNTVHGAAKRIIWLLESGLPDDHWGQRVGRYDPCYLDQQVQA